MQESEREPHIRLLHCVCVACFMPDCEKQHTELVAVNKSKHFRGRGVELVKPGWRSVYSLSPFAAPQDGDRKEVDDQSTSADGGDSMAQDADADEEEATSDSGNLCAIASKLKENDTLACVLPAEVKCEHTRPPPLLNEASLLFLMETAAKYVAKKGGSAGPRPQSTSRPSSHNSNARCVSCVVCGRICSL